MDTPRDRVKREAAATADQLTGWLEAVDALRIAGVPRKVRRRDLNGATRWTRDSAEHDELDLLSQAELDRLRDGGWLTHDDGVGTKGYRADIVLERMADTYSLGSPDEAWARWLQATKLIDAARIVAQGRTPRAAWLDGWPWWLHVAPVCAADGIDVRAVLAGSDDTGTVTARVADVNRALADYLGRLVYPPKVEYARAYAAHVTAGTKPPKDPGTSWAPDVRRKVDRYYRMGEAA